MSRRIDVELTSDRGDGTWSWRAAGARQPKGVVDALLLYDDAQVGDVVRAEADFDIEGITIISVQAPKSVRREPERIEIIGVEREFSPVTSSLTGKARERAEQGHDERPRRSRDDRGPRPSGRPGGPGRDGARDGARGPRPDGERSSRPPRERPAPPPPKPKPKKLRPARVHRDAFLAALAPEQQPIAEQLLRGGMPAVRTALADQNAKAQAEGGLEIPTTTVLGIAEQLVTAARVADWLDRAEAARATGDELALRDLRSVVSSAEDVARDETTRELAAELKATLEQRTEDEQRTWLTDIEQSLTGGRVVRALRLSSRPPEPGTSFPDELMTRLAEAANGALTDDIASDRWATVLDAVAYSPVRRSVTPAGIPAEPSEALLAAVRKHAGRAPAIAAMFGIGAPESSKAAKASKRPAKAAGRNPNVSRAGGLRNAAVPVPGRPGGPPVPPARRIPPPPGRQIGATLPGSAPVPPPAPAPQDPTTPLAPASATGPDESAATRGTPEAAPAAMHSTDAPADAPVAGGSEAAGAPVTDGPEAALVDLPATESGAEHTDGADGAAPEAAAADAEAALVLDAAPTLLDAPSPTAAPAEPFTAEAAPTDGWDATASDAPAAPADASAQTPDPEAPGSQPTADEAVAAPDQEETGLAAVSAEGTVPAPDTASSPEAAAAPPADTAPSAPGDEAEPLTAGAADAVLSGEMTDPLAAPAVEAVVPPTASPQEVSEAASGLEASSPAPPATEVRSPAPTDALAAPAAEAAAASGAGDQPAGTGTPDASPADDASADELTPALSAPADSSLPEPSPVGDVDSDPDESSDVAAGSERAGVELVGTEQVDTEQAGSSRVDTEDGHAEQAHADRVEAEQGQAEGAGAQVDVDQVDAMVSQAAGGPFEPPAAAPVEQAPNSAVGPVHVEPPAHEAAPAEQEDHAS